MRDKKGRFAKDHEVPQEWREEFSRRLKNKPISYWLGKERADFQNEKNPNWNGGKRIKICLHCGIEFLVWPYQEVKKPRKYCSKSCADIAKTGIPLTEDWKRRMSENAGKMEKSHRWQGGRKKHKFGYIMIYNPDHPYAQKGGYIFEHRLIAEKYLKRRLTKKEIVHHIDGDKTNNDPKNLYVFNSHSEHLKYEFAKIKIPLHSNLIEPR